MKSTAWGAGEVSWSAFITTRARDDASNADCVLKTQ